MPADFNSDTDLYGYSKPFCLHIFFLYNLLIREFVNLSLSDNI